MKNNFYLLFIILFLKSSMSWAGSSSVVISDYVILRGKSTISLKDVARFKNLDKKTVELLERIRLGNAPKLGEKREFSNVAISEMIRGTIKRLNKNLKRKISLKVPQKIIIENPKDLVSLFEVKQSLLSSYKRICSDCRFTIDNISLPKISEDIFVKSWTIDEIEDLPRGSFQHALWVYTQKEQKKIYWITGSLKVKRQVPVAKRLIKYGERIQKNDVEMKWKDISFKRNSVLPLKNIVGKIVRGFLREGQFISAHNIDREKALKRGDLINVEVSSGEWVIKMKAVAEEDGYVGDTVKIRNVKTKKLISGVVVEKGRVKVE